MIIYRYEIKRRYSIRHKKARLIRGKFLVKARKLGVLALTFIALAAILRASGVDDPRCDRSSAIVMQCALLRRTCPDGGMVTLDNANAQRITDAYICDVCAGYDKNDPLSECICTPRAADMLWRNFYAEAETPEGEVRGAREASHDGFSKRDRNTLNAIYDAAVLGKEPDDKRQSGVTRHKQVEFGAKLAVSQKLSANAAARRAIEAYADEQGAYTASEEESLARAIRRELKK